MTKPTGAICNLDCSDRFYLDKEALYPVRLRMRDELPNVRWYITPSAAFSPCDLRT